MDTMDNICYKFNFTHFCLHQSIPLPSVKHFHSFMPLQLPQTILIQPLPCPVCHPNVPSLWRCTLPTPSLNLLFFLPIPQLQDNSRPAPSHAFPLPLVPYLCDTLCQLLSCPLSGQQHVEPVKQPPLN